MPDVSTVPRPPRSQLVAAFASVYLIWGSTYLAIRFAIETMPPHLMAAVRFLVAGALLYVWARWRGAPRPTRANWRAAAVVGGFLLLGGNGAVVWAETRVPSGLTALLVAMVPIWMLVLEMLPRLGGRKPRAAVVAGIVLGLVGLVVLVAPGRLAGRVDPLGAGVLLLGCLSWAFGSLYSRGAELPKSGFLAAAMEMVAGGFLLLLLLAYLIVFGSLIGFTAYIWLLGATTSARVSTYAYVNPVVAVLLGWAFANEPMSLRTLIAAAVIIGAVVLIIRYGAKREIAAPAATERAAEADLLPRKTAGGRA